MYKGGLTGFPKEIVEKMLEHQVKQGNKKDVTVFENDITSSSLNKGFNWSAASEGRTFWSDVVLNKKFKLFFDKYPKIEEDEDEMLFDLANEHLTDEHVERLYSNRFGKN